MKRDDYEMLADIAGELETVAEEMKKRGDLKPLYHRGELGHVGHVLLEEKVTLETLAKRIRDAYAREVEPLEQCLRQTLCEAINTKGCEAIENNLRRALSNYEMLNHKNGR